MPNWCNNKMIVKNMNYSKFNKLYYDNGNFSFEKVIPIGEWNYDKALDSWGTKWDAANESVYDENIDDSFILEFQTAWSPPDPIVNKLNENHPDAKFKLLYYEPGCDFCGVNSRDGDYTYNISEDIKDFWDEDLKSYIEDEKSWD